MANSWQQPVAGEPSLGTWHDITTPDNTYPINGQVVAAGPTWYTATFTIGTTAGDCPVGTKSVRCFVQAYGTAGNGKMYYRPYGSGAGAAAGRVLLIFNSAHYAGNQVEVPVDSSGRCEFTADAGNTITVGAAGSYSV